jgi:hypothetical protein
MNFAIKDPVFDLALLERVGTPPSTLIQDGGPFSKMRSEGHYCCFSYALLFMTWLTIFYGFLPLAVSIRSIIDKVIKVLEDKHALDIYSVGIINSKAKAM